MMKVRLVENEMINADIVKPVMTVATFNDNLAQITKENIVNYLNNGQKMLEIYEKYIGNNSTNTPIHTVYEMIQDMHEVFRNFDHERYIIRNKNND